MIKQLIFLLLCYNVIINYVVAYSNANRIDYSGPKYESQVRLMRPTSDLIQSNIKSNDPTLNSEKNLFYSQLENWTGRWIPDHDSQSTTIPTINKQYNDIDNNESVSMGSAHPDCDNGKTKLNVDWNNSPVNYTCYGKKIIPSYAINPIWYCEHIPPTYSAIHRCMNYTIEYDDDIPLYGTHRPVWPVYGEYKFLPPQRWIHNLEHGAIVMLYHPCANPQEINLLKDLVKRCLRRHIITSYNRLDINQPLALVTWGCRLTMSYVDKDLVTRFIHKKALHGPENIDDDGEFVEGLLNAAKIVSDKSDSQLCPPLD